MLRDALKTENKITESCRDELKFELLQRVRNERFLILFLKEKYLFRVKALILIHH
jgi:hypothetical protein